MTIKLSEVVKDKTKIDLVDICSAWTWLISEQKEVLLVTVFGDLFLIGADNEINWLDTGGGTLTRVADSIKHFEELLKDNENFSDWFMTKIYVELQEKKIYLKDNEVYSYIKMPLLSGEYKSDNFKPVDISVHFNLCGQICEQTKDTPDGTHVKVTTSRQKPWWKFW